MADSAGERSATATDHLTALDATFLELEQADQSAHMHIGGVMIFDPRPGGGAPPIERVRAELEARLPDLPRFRDRLSEPETGGLRWPSWEEDERFDIRNHVSRAALPAPAGEPELLEWAGEYYSQRLDRTRALWEAAVIELGDGRWAMATKTHHCMVDGIASVDIGQTILDAEPDPPPRRSAEPEAASGPRRSAIRTEERDGSRGGLTRAAAPIALPARLLARGLRTGAAATRRLVGAGLDVAVHPGKAAEAVRRSRAMAELVIRDEVIAAPRTSLNEPIGAHRRLAVIDASLEEVKEVKRALGGTVNDVVLAAAAGGLRALLLARGEPLPERGLRAMVPVNIRTAADALGRDNRISSLFVHLPVAEEAPTLRYRRQLEEAEGLKAGTQALGSSTLVSVSSLAPPALHSFLARSMYATRLFNLTITNVPGPQLPLYAFGSRMGAVWPLVPLAAEHAVGLAVLSYDGRLFFCLNADRDTVPDLEVLRNGIEASIAELLEAARRPSG